METNKYIPFIINKFNTFMLASFLKFSRISHKTTKKQTFYHYNTFYLIRQQHPLTKRNSPSVILTPLRLGLVKAEMTNKRSSRLLIYHYILTIHYYIFRRYCPPHSYKARVISPKLATLTVSINSLKMFSPSVAAFFNLFSASSLFSSCCC